MGAAVILSSATGAHSQLAVGERVSGEEEVTRVRVLPVAVDDRGVAEVETVVLDKDVVRVEFRVDGEEVETRKRPPYTAKIRFEGEGPFTLTAIALDGSDRRVGEDTVTVQREARPLRLRIHDSEIVEEAGGRTVRVELDLSAPDPSLLAELTVSLDGQVVARRGADQLSLGRRTLEVPVPSTGVSRGSVLVAELELVDGTRLDDAVPLGEAVLREEVEVRLMQLQVVVLDGSGRPVGGLGTADFRVEESGDPVEIEDVFPAPDISLLLGLAVDSSGSMQAIWDQTRLASEQFLQRTLSQRDRAFLVDFDIDLRLLTGATGDAQELRDGLAEIEPEGGTALYDSIVFSLLQFQREPGRRGLVVITDGVDAGSLTDPQRTIDLARRFGVPVYIVALQQRGVGSGPGSGPGGRRRGLGGDLASRVHTLRLLTDPSGGRLFRAGSARAVEAALEQIGTELRNQYVLTYYTGEEIDWRDPPRIEVEVPGRKVEVKTIWGVDRLQ